MWFFGNGKKEKEQLKNTALKNTKSEYEIKIEVLKKKIAEFEYLEFKYRRDEVMRKFYEAAKNFSYEMLEDIKKSKK